MVAYGVVIAMTIAVYLFTTQMQYDKERIDRITVTFFFLAYIFLLCSRDISIGVDTKHYVKTYEMLSQLNWTSAFALGNGEVGFVALEKLIAFLGGTRLFISLVAIVTVLPVMYLYRNEAEGSMICISFFIISLLFEMFFSGMRQGIAIALAVPAYYMVKKRKIIPFILIVILACLFHKSAVLIALLYPIYHAKITKKWLWFVHEPLPPTKINSIYNLSSPFQHFIHVKIAPKISPKCYPQSIILFYFSKFKRRSSNLSNK